MRASVYIFCIVTRWSPQNFPFIWKFNEMESNKLLDSFCTKFVWVYLLLLCRFWGVCEKKESTTIFYLSTQRFQCNKRAHVFFWRMQWFIVSWLGNDTFVFDVILFTFFLSYIYHTIFISNRCYCFKVSKLIAWIWHQNHCHSNNLKGKKRRAKMEFIIYLQTKSHLWIFNAVWTFMFFLFRMMSNIMLLFLLKWRWKKSYLYISIKKKNQNHNRNELEPDRNNSH